VVGAGGERALREQRADDRAAQHGRDHGEIARHGDLAALAELVDALGRRLVDAAVRIVAHGCTVSVMACAARWPAPSVSRTSAGAVA
jgi:hypothetical protein